jgi:hypothetical protein
VKIGYKKGYNAALSDVEDLLVAEFDRAMDAGDFEYASGIHKFISKLPF